MNSNRFSKYLLYAFGEIVLVVIGILIALQINNWNEEQKVHTEEQKYLLALKEEFEYNRTQLAKVLESNAQYGDAAHEMLNHTGPVEPSLSEEEFIELFIRMVNSEVQYRPSNGVLEEVISSGKLGMFRDPELRKLLSSWDGLLYSIQFQEQELNAMRMELVDMVNEDGNVRELFYTTRKNQFKLTPSRFEIENRTLLRSPIFENRTMSFLATSRFTNAYYYPKVEERIEEMLKLIHQNLNG